MAGEPVPLSDRVFLLPGPKGHLAALRAEGLAVFRLEEGRLLWERR